MATSLNMMNWVLLIVNVAIIAISVRKRVLPFAILSLFFVALVIGQSFQIGSDMTGAESVLYRYAYMSLNGYRSAQWYLLGTSLLTLGLVTLGRGLQPNQKTACDGRFAPPKMIYFLLLAYLVLVSFVLIFVVVGFHEFLTSSRPGYQSGSTIYIVLLAIGIFPLFLKIIHQSQVNFGDVTCFIIATAVTTGFSRIHVILYVTILLTLLYYCGGWWSYKITLGTALWVSAVGLLGIGGFFGIGAIRDAENFTGASFSGISQYLLEHPDQSLLSLSTNYRIGVEGMSGLSGAFTVYDKARHSENFDYGIYWIGKGILQWLPGFAKPYFSSLTDNLDSLQWYGDSIISPGIESSFESFGWLGMVFYSLSFFLLAWTLPLKVFSGKLSGGLVLPMAMVIGCGIFFVRGSLIVWIGYSIAYVAVSLLSWPIWEMCIYYPQVERRKLV